MPLSMINHDNRTLKKGKTLSKNGLEGLVVCCIKEAIRMLLFANHNNEVAYNNTFKHFYNLTKIRT